MMKQLLHVGIAFGIALVTLADSAVGQSTGSPGAPATPASPPTPATAAAAAAPQVSQGPADSLYRSARTTMNAGDYRAAADLFEQLVGKYPASPAVADALYWRGYALFQSGNSTRSTRDFTDALAALDQYRSLANGAASQASDIAELRARIRAAQAELGNADAAGDIAQSAQRLTQPGGCANSEVDQATRMAALQGLLNMNSSDAVPILKDVLKQRDACRAELRKKAVWLISQKQDPAIVATLLDVARNDPSLDVRGTAVFWLSQTHSEQVIPTLDSILSSAGDREIRQKAIFALSQHLSDERANQALRHAIENEQLPADLRGEAVFWLGNSASNENLPYFKSVFTKSTDNDLRSRIVQAVSNTKTPEAAAWLLDVARNKSFDVDTRKKALFWAGQQKAFDIEQLSSVYAQAKDEPEIQRQVLFVYSQRHEPVAVDKLMAVAKSDSNIEMRKQALFWLGQKSDPRAKQFIRDLIIKP